MSVRELRAHNGDVEDFVALEREMIGSHRFYVPGGEREIVRRLSGRSKLHRDVSAALFVAGRSARAAAFVNERYQRWHGEAVGFVGYFAAAERAGSATADVLGACEQWLRAHACTRVIAPYNANELGGTGVRTAAFDEPPMYPFQWSPPWFPEQLDAAGYRPTYPWLWYTTDLRAPTFAARVRRTLNDAPCEIRRLERKRWREELESFMTLCNAAFAREWEYHPSTIDEFDEVYTPFRNIFDRAQFLFARDGGRAVGVCVGVADFNETLRRLGGRTGPVSALRFTLGVRRPREAGLVMIAVLPEYHGRGVGRALVARLYRRYVQLRLRRAHYYLVSERNAASRALAESFGGTGRVLYHTFDKPL